MTRVSGAWLEAAGTQAVFAMLAAAGCAQQPELPTNADGTVDAELEQGSRVWLQRCSSCHGVDGAGGIGPKLSDGLVVDNYPDAAVEKSIVQNGLNGNKMPAFTDILSDEEIDAVVRYTREVL